MVWCLAAGRDGVVPSNWSRWCGDEQLVAMVWCLAAGRDGVVPSSWSRWCAA